MVLVNKDDELKTDRMIALTQEFIADRNVLALAGYQNTGGIAAVSKQDIPGKAGIAMISPFQGDKSIVGNGWGGVDLTVIGANGKLLR